MDSNNPPIVKEISQGSNKRKYLLLDRCDINKNNKIISQEVQLEIKNMKSFSMVEGKIFCGSSIR